jgi:hypothetical protein
MQSLSASTQLKVLATVLDGIPCHHSILLSWRMGLGKQT